MVTTTAQEILSAKGADKISKDFFQLAKDKWKDRKVQILFGGATTAAGAIGLAITVLVSSTLWPLAAAVLAVGLATLAYVAISYLYSKFSQSIAQDMQPLTEVSVQQLGDVDPSGNVVGSRLPEPRPEVDSETNIPVQLYGHEPSGPLPLSEPDPVVGENQHPIVYYPDGVPVRAGKEEAAQVAPSATSPVETPDKALLTTSDKILAASNLVKWGVLGAGLMGVSSVFTVPIATIASVSSEIAAFCMLPEHASIVRKAMSIPVVAGKLIALNPIVNGLFQAHSLFSFAQGSASKISQAWSQLGSHSGAKTAGAVHLFNLASGAAFAAESVGLIKLKPTEPAPTPSPTPPPVITPAPAATSPVTTPAPAPTPVVPQPTTPKLPHNPWANPVLRSAPAITPIFVPMPSPVVPQPTTPKLPHNPWANPVLRPAPAITPISAPTPSPVVLQPTTPKLPHNPWANPVLRSAPAITPIFVPMPSPVVPQPTTPKLPHNPWANPVLRPAPAITPISAPTPSPVVLQPTTPKLPHNPWANPVLRPAPAITPISAPTPSPVVPQPTTPKLPHNPWANPVLRPAPAITPISAPTPSPVVPQPTTPKLPHNPWANPVLTPAPAITPISAPTPSPVVPQPTTPKLPHNPWANPVLTPAPAITPISAPTRSPVVPQPTTPKLSHNPWANPVLTPAPVFVPTASVPTPLPVPPMPPHVNASLTAPLPAGFCPKPFTFVNGTDTSLAIPRFVLPQPHGFTLANGTSSSTSIPLQFLRPVDPPVKPPTTPNPRLHTTPNPWIGAVNVPSKPGLPPKMQYVNASSTAPLSVDGFCPEVFKPINGTDTSTAIPRLVLPQPHGFTPANGTSSSTSIPLQFLRPVDPPVKPPTTSNPRLHTTPNPWMGAVNVPSKPGLPPKMHYVNASSTAPLPVGGFCPEVFKPINGTDTSPAIPRLVLPQPHGFTPANGTSSTYTPPYLFRPPELLQPPVMPFRNVSSTEPYSFDGFCSQPFTFVNGTGTSPALPQPNSFTTADWTNSTYTPPYLFRPPELLQPPVMPFRNVSSTEPYSFDGFCPQPFTFVNGTGTSPALPEPNGFTPVDRTNSTYTPSYLFRPQELVQPPVMLFRNVSATDPYSFDGFCSQPFTFVNGTGTSPALPQPNSFTTADWTNSTYTPPYLFRPPELLQPPVMPFRNVSSTEPYSFDGFCPELFKPINGTDTSPALPQPNGFTTADRTNSTYTPPYLFRPPELVQPPVMPFRNVSATDPYSFDGFCPQPFTFVNGTGTSPALPQPNGFTTADRTNSTYTPPYLFRPPELVQPPVMPFRNVSATDPYSFDGFCPQPFTFVNGTGTSPALPEPNSFTTADRTNSTYTPPYLFRPPELVQPPVMPFRNVSATDPYSFDGFCSQPFTFVNGTGTSPALPQPNGFTTADRTNSTYTPPYLFRPQELVQPPVMPFRNVSATDPYSFDGFCPQPFTFVNGTGTSPALPQPNGFTTADRTNSTYTPPYLFRPQELVQPPVMPFRNVSATDPYSFDGFCPQPFTFVNGTGTNPALPEPNGFTTADRTNSTYTPPYLFRPPELVQPLVMPFRNVSSAEPYSFDGFCPEPFIPVNGTDPCPAAPILIPKRKFTLGFTPADRTNSSYTPPYLLRSPEWIRPPITQHVNVSLTEPFSIDEFCPEPFKPVNGTDSCPALPKLPPQRPLAPGFTPINPINGSCIPPHFLRPPEEPRPAPRPKVLQDRQGNVWNSTLVGPFSVALPTCLANGTRSVDPTCPARITSSAPEPVPQWVNDLTNAEKKLCASTHTPWLGSWTPTAKRHVDHNICVCEREKWHENHQVDLPDPEEREALNPIDCSIKKFFPGNE